MNTKRGRQMTIKQKLIELEITLPEPARAVGSYVPVVKGSGLLFVSGQLEVAEWHHILWSNRSMLHILCYGMFGFGGYYLVRNYVKKRMGR